MQGLCGRGQARRLIPRKAFFTGIFELLWPKVPGQVPASEACLPSRSGVAVCERRRPKPSQLLLRRGNGIFDPEYSGGSSHPTILTPVPIGGFSTSNNSVAPASPGCPIINSILTLSTWIQCQILQVKGWVPGNCPSLHFRPQSKSKLSPGLLTHWLYRWGGSNKPFLLEWLAELRETFHFLVCWFIVKGCNPGRLQPR